MICILRILCLQEGKCLEFVVDSDIMRLVLGRYLPKTSLRVLVTAFDKHKPSNEDWWEAASRASGEVSKQFKTRKLLPLNWRFMEIATWALR